MRSGQFILDVGLAPLNHFLQVVGVEILSGKKPARSQIAALCVRRNAKGRPEILMITTRTSKRWIIPKGWPLSRHSGAKTAEVEAFEEAGLVGKADKKSIGKYFSSKKMDSGKIIDTETTVYFLNYEKEKKSFPEKGQRKIAWVSLDEAIERCGDKGLKKFLEKGKVKKLLKQVAGS